MKIALPIISTYVPRWGAWECLREITQNAKDEEDQRGHAMSIIQERGWLRVSNEGADLDRRALLLGFTSKADDPAMRGKFGEGLNLALLAGVRAGMRVVVETQTEVWVPRIEPSSDFGGESCLAVEIKKAKVKRDGVRVSMRMTADEWEKFRKLFLFLDPPKDAITVPYSGTLILDEDRHGMIFSKGMFVSRLKDTTFGYDIPSLDLDRDRRMAEPFTLRLKLSGLLRDAGSAEPERVTGQLMDMLHRSVEEVADFAWYLSRDSTLSGAMLKRFQEKHGEDAIPVRSIGQSQELAHLGKRGVVVSESLANVLDKALGTYEEVRSKLRFDAVKRLGWDDLSEPRRQALAMAVGLVGRVTDARGLNLMDRIQIVEYDDPTLLGSHTAGSITIAAKVLDDYYELVRALVHEVAHDIGTDGTHEHIAAVEGLWMKILRDVCPNPSWSVS